MVGVEAEFGRYTSVSVPILLNALFPMLCTLSGICTVVSAVSKNAMSSIVRSVDGKLTEERFEQPLNACFPTVVRPSGSSMEVRDVQSKNICVLSAAALSGSCTDSRAKQFSKT